MSTRCSVIAAIAFSLMLGPAFAASITYDVFLKGSSNTLRGQITTNGAVGILTADSITSWHLDVTGGFAGAYPFTNVSGASAPMCAPGGCALYATPDLLIFWGTANNLELRLIDAGSSIVFNSVPSWPGSVTYTKNLVGGTSYSYDVFSLPKVIGVATPVPEPVNAVLMLFGLGLIGLVFVRKRSWNSRMTRHRNGPSLKTSHLTAWFP